MKLRKYETVYVVRADLTEEKKQSLFDRLSGIIEEGGGKVLRLDDWGVRKTAYPVQKHSKAHYIQITYAGVPGVVAELERIFRMLDEVMKFYSMRVPVELTEEELGQELIKTEPRRDESSDRGERRGRRRDESREEPRETQAAQEKPTEEPVEAAPAADAGEEVAPAAEA